MTTAIETSGASVVSDFSRGEAKYLISLLERSEDDFRREVRDHDDEQLFYVKVLLCGHPKLAVGVKIIDQEFVLRFFNDIRSFKTARDCYDMKDEMREVIPLRRRWKVEVVWLALPALWFVVLTTLLAVAWACLRESILSGLFQ